MPAPPTATPRPPLVYRVGVTGHRPDRLGHANPDRLAAQVRTLLVGVQQEVSHCHTTQHDWFDRSPPVLRMCSALAEGADRIVATTALELGYELACMLPFPRAEYERDFEPPAAAEADSLARFRALLRRASSCLELDGDRADEAAAYGACGTAMLAQVDLLIVVWDGVRGHKRGGTEDVMHAALEHGIPVVWVDARQPHAWRLLRHRTELPPAAATGRAEPDRPSDAAGLQQAIRDALQLPAEAQPGAAGRRQPSPLRQFYDERVRPRTLAFVWPLFRDLVGGRSSRARPAAVTPVAGPAADPAGPTIAALEPYYDWVDRLSVRSADRYRSAFVLAFLLAALAVAMALLPVGASLDPHQPLATACSLVELAAIALILVIVFVGARSKWHERWIDYRLLAEMIRQLQVVAPLGGGRPHAQVPAHWSSYGHPQASWMGWYVRAIERALGGPDGVIDAERNAAHLRHLERILDAQRRFHDAASARAHRIEHRLHLLGIACLAATATSCVLHLWLHAAPLTFCCGFLPALGAAMAGIANQGEFRRITRRSRAMRDQLARLQADAQGMLAAAGPGQQRSAAVGRLGREIARLMITEVLDWRVVFLDQPLRPPA